MPELKAGEASPRDMLAELEKAWAGAPGYLTSTALPVGRLVPGLLLLLRELVGRVETLEAVVHELAPEPPPAAPALALVHNAEGRN